MCERGPEGERERESGCKILLPQHCASQEEEEEEVIAFLSLHWIWCNGKMEKALSQMILHFGREHSRNFKALVSSLARSSGVIIWKKNPM